MAHRVLYGLIYFEAAWNPERGCSPAAAGLLGKIFRRDWAGGVRFALSLHDSWTPPLKRRRGAKVGIFGRRS